MDSLFDGIIFEDQCIHCGHERISSDIPLCSRCASMLRPAVNVFKNADNHKIYYMCKYNDVSGILIKSFKYNAFIEAGLFMSVILAAGIEQIGEDATIAYIPFDRIRRFNRFYNHGQMLADFTSEITGMKVVHDLLHKKISFITQAKMPVFLRKRRNIRFNSRKTDIKRIIIIDDVVTSGKTLTSAMNSIKESNCKMEVIGLCFAGN